METGLLAIWLWHGLRALGVPVDCLHARHVAATLSLQVNKTDANDAHGIAQVVRAGWYRVVAVKSLQSGRVRAVLSARSQLVAMRTGLYSRIQRSMRDQRIHPKSFLKALAIAASAASLLCRLS